MKYRADIDGLRTLAILPVVFFHAGVPGFNGGFVGVDIFFVISGYLITRTVWDEIATDSFSIVRFYDRRIRRIFPALFTTIIVVLAVGYYTTPPNELQELGASAVSAALFVSNIFFWAKNGYFDVASDQRPFLHMWSLSVEEQFYIFFPIFLIVAHRYRLYHRGVMWLILVASLVLSAVGVVLHPNSTFFLLPTRAWELLSGGVIAVRAVPRIEGRTAAQILSAAGLACIAASVVLFTRDTSFPGLAAVLPCLGAALIIYAGTSGHGTAVSRLLSTTPFVFVGLISYSLYLWHWPLLVFASSVPPTSVPIDPVVPAVLLAAGLAYLSWRFVERPFRRPPQPYLPSQQRRPFAFAGLTILAVIAIGAAYQDTGGLPRRDSHFRQIAATSEAGRRAKERMHPGRCSTNDPRIGNLCVSIGQADATKTIVVWGDSFADSWKTAFDSVGRELHVRVEVISHVGCPPLVNVERPENGGAAARCHDPERAKLTLSYLERLRPAHTFLVSRWNIYDRGDWLNGRLKREPAFLTDDQSKTTSAVVTQQVIARNLQLVLASFAKIGPVTVFRSTPNYTKTASRMSFDNDSDAVVSVAQHHAWQAHFDSVLDRVAAATGAHVFDPAAKLCADGVCRWRDSVTGLLYYENASHITWVASSLFIEDIANLVRQESTLDHVAGTP